MSALWLRGAERLPTSIALSLIPSLPREHLERLVQQLIDRMDEADGDPDVELNGDEQDGGNGEDDFGVLPKCILGPGCPIADDDCDMSNDEENGDAERAGTAPNWSTEQ